MGTIRTFRSSISRLCQALAVLAAVLAVPAQGVAGSPHCCLTVDNDTPCHIAASDACCALCGLAWTQGSLAVRSVSRLAFTTADPRPLGAGSTDQINDQPALPPPRA